MGRQDDHDFSFFLKEQHNCKLKLDMQMVRLPLYIIYWVCFRRVGTCSDCIEAAHSWDDITGRLLTPTPSGGQTIYTPCYSYLHVFVDRVFLVLAKDSFDAFYTQYLET